jgi:antitoxin component of MazEF toxin-antitoxin module
MQNLYTSKVVRIGTAIGVIIPVDICRALDIQRGDLIAYAVYQDGQFICRKLSPIEMENLKPREILMD